MQSYINFLEFLGPWFRRKFAWMPHNLIAHPVSEVLHWFGAESMANAIHDFTVVKDLVPKDEQRG